MIAALILAAGQSKRMGQPKMLLPWGETTVLETVIATYRAAGIDNILVITGGAREQVEVGWRYGTGGIQSKFCKRRDAEFRPGGIGGIRA